MITLDLAELRTGEIGRFEGFSLYVSEPVARGQLRQERRGGAPKVEAATWVQWQVMVWPAPAGAWRRSTSAHGRRQIVKQRQRWVASQ